MVVDTDTIQRTAAQHLWPAGRDWTQMAEEGGPDVIVGGHGVKVVDSTGKTWIDVNGGYASVNVGYGRTEIAEAAYEQMKRLAFFPQRTTTEATVKLTEKVAQLAPGALSRVFPVSGGSEAVETAIKIARAYHHRMGVKGRYKIVSRRGSYHGGTGATLWLGGGNASREEYEPAPPGLIYVPQPHPYRCELGGESASECAVKCAEELEKQILFHNPDTVAAFIGEPVATPKGAAVPGDEYWPMVREICSKYGVLLIADEVVNGFGRTGKMFASEHWDLEPDIMAIAKGIVSSYVPLGAAVATDEVAGAFVGEGRELRHVFTFTGHPVAAAAGLKNIEIIETEGLVENAAVVGAYFKEQLEGLMGDHPIVGDVRGLGMIVAAELVSDRETKASFSPELKIADRLNESFRNSGLLYRMSGDIMSMNPPLCITRDEVDEIVHAIDLALWKLEGELGLSKPL